MDARAEEHLASTLGLLKRVAGVELRVVKVDSDGSCLPYAVSRCLVGKEILYDALRQALVEELTENEAFYRAKFEQGMSDETWAAHFAQVVDEARPTFGARTGRWLGPGEHVLAMANVLGRPILVLDELEAMKRDHHACGLFLPLRLSREEILARARPKGVLPGPIVIGWASPAHNHFVSLLRCAPDDPRDSCIKGLPQGTWNEVERIVYGATGRTFEMPLTVPLNIPPGGACVLRDESTKQEIRVPIPADKKPGDTFTAKVTRPSPPLERALVTLVGENGKTARNRALKTLETLVANLVDAALSGNAQQLAKCSRVKLDNALIQANVVAVPGALDVLAALGFNSVAGELVFGAVVDAEFVNKRDVVAYLSRTLVDVPSVPGDGEVTAGMEAELFGPEPAAMGDSWAAARETFASDASDASPKRAAAARREGGVWIFGTGRVLSDERKAFVDSLVTALRGNYEDLAAGTDLAKVEWDNLFLYNRRLTFVRCPDCNEDQDWTGPVDGSYAEAHIQDCAKCGKRLKAEMTGARKILAFVADASSGQGVFAPAYRCSACERLNLGGNEACWKCGAKRP